MTNLVFESVMTLKDMLYRQTYIIPNRLIYHHIVGRDGAQIIFTPISSAVDQSLPPCWTVQLSVTHFRISLPEEIMIEFISTVTIPHQHGFHKLIFVVFKI